MAALAKYALVLGRMRALARPPRIVLQTADRPTAACIQSAHGPNSLRAGSSWIDPGRPSTSQMRRRWLFLGVVSCRSGLCQRVSPLDGRSPACMASARLLQRARCGSRPARPSLDVCLCEMMPVVARAVGRLLRASPRAQGDPPVLRCVSSSESSRRGSTQSVGGLPGNLEIRSDSAALAEIMPSGTRPSRPSQAKP